jgi:hypothetical protein
VQIVAEAAGVATLPYPGIGGRRIERQKPPILTPISASRTAQIEFHRAEFSKSRGAAAASANLHRAAVEAAAHQQG